MDPRPFIKKLGTIDCDMVETTPVIRQGRLLRFEYVRADYQSNTSGRSFFRFKDVENGETTPGFAHGYHLGSAHIQNGEAYVYGVGEWGDSKITVFHSGDLVHWESSTALQTDGWGVYNNSVCEGPDGFVMAFEVGEPPEVVGVRFTNRFAVSDDLINWRLLPEKCVFTLDRYSACPVLRYINPYYYMIYLEEYPGPCYRPHIVRTRDFIHWQDSPYNPILHESDEDKRPFNPLLTQEQIDRISGIRNVNNSDVDLCEYKGKTIIFYSWGTQMGDEFLAQAEYDGPMNELLESFFAENN